MSQYEDISKGEQARTLLENELFNEAFDTLEASLVATLLDLPIEADSQRLKLVCMHKAAQQVRTILSNYVAGADIARAELLEAEQRKSLLERIKEKVRG